MPRNPIVNRRNVSDLRRRTVSVSDDAHDQIAALAAKLHVSQGSLIDTAMRELARQPAEVIVDRMVGYGHLTDDERHVVDDKATKADKHPDETRDDKDQP